MSRIARENAFILQYEKLVLGYQNEITYTNMTSVNGDFTKDDKKYVDVILNGINNKQDLLNDIITKYAKGYALNRVYLVDKAILLIAIYEILYLDKIPFKVSINEAVELAKKFSTDNSPVFINGVLASVNKDKELILTDESKDN